MQKISCKYFILEDFQIIYSKKNIWITNDSPIPVLQLIPVDNCESDYKN